MASTTKTFITTFWRGNPQSSNGGYETTRTIEAKSIKGAMKRVKEIENNVAYGTMSFRHIEEKVTETADNKEDTTMNNTYLLTFNTATNFRAMTVKELREICKQAGIKSYGHWTKEEMVKAIEDAFIEALKAAEATEVEEAETEEIKAEAEAEADEAPKAEAKSKKSSKKADKKADKKVVPAAELPEIENFAELTVKKMKRLIKSLGYKYRHHAPRVELIETLNEIYAGKGVC